MWIDEIVYFQKACSPLKLSLFTKIYSWKVLIMFFFVAMSKQSCLFLFDNIHLFRKSLRVNVVKFSFTIKNILSLRDFFLLVYIKEKSGWAHFCPTELTRRFCDKSALHDIHNLGFLSWLFSPHRRAKFSNVTIFHYNTDVLK